MNQSTQPKPPSPQDSLLVFYWRAIIRSRLRAAVMIFGLMSFSAVLEVLTLVMALPLMQTLMSPDPATEQNRPVAVIRTAVEWLGLPQDRSVLLLVILVTASLFFAAHSLCVLVIQYVTIKQANQLLQQTKLALFRSYVQAPYPAVVNRGRATVLYDVNKMPEAVYTSIDQVAGLAMGLVQGVLLLALMLKLSWWATLSIILLGIFGVRALHKLLDHRARAHGENLYRIQSNQSRISIDAIDGFKVVKTQGLEQTVVQKLKVLLSDELFPVMRMNLFRKAPTFIDETAAAVIVIVLGTISLLKPAWGMDFPSLVLFLMAIRRCSPAMAGVNSGLVELNGTRRNVQAISDVLDKLEPERQGGAAVANVSNLQLSGVSFSYPSRPEAPALRDVSIKFELGTITAIVGPTGSGKSTLANLVLGLMTPSAGSILVDGAPLETLSLADWRRNVGYVAQDVFLFNASIRDNIALWNTDASQAELERAARTAELHEFIAGLPEGYDTVVGDRGVALSGGQCQRLAIARAVFRRPRVFVFDEATSALDNTTERAVYNAIRNLRQDAIVIVVAHRLSTIREAEQIVVLDAGRVVESGAHQTLLDRGGVYAKLFQVDSTMSRA